MKKNKKKTLVGALAAVLLFSGRNIGGRQVIITSGLGSQDVFRIGSASCKLTDAKVYLANYQNIYGKIYGIDLWKQGFLTDKLKKYVKDIALSEMTKIVCMDLLAQERDISLTEDELQATKTAAAEYYKSLNEEELEFTGASETGIAAMYEKYALANKVYESLTAGVDDEVSDDEARIMEAMQIFVKGKDEADAVAAKLNAGEDFAAVASNYNQKPEIEITFGRGELPKEAEEAAFELNNDEISGGIAVEGGYYFIKCINKFNEELTDANKSKIVAAREKAAFDDVYEAFVLGLSSGLNEKVWDDITLITDGSIMTDSFFSVLEDAMD